MRICQGFQAGCLSMTFLLSSHNRLVFTKSTVKTQIKVVPRMSPRLLVHFIFPPISWTIQLHVDAFLSLGLGLVAASASFFLQFPLLLLFVSALPLSTPSSPRSPHQFWFWSRATPHPGWSGPALACWHSCLLPPLCPRPSCHGCLTSWLLAGLQMTSNPKDWSVFCGSC